MKYQTKNLFIDISDAILEIFLFIFCGNVTRKVIFLVQNCEEYFVIFIIIAYLEVNFHNLVPRASCLARCEGKTHWEPGWNFQAF